MTADGPNPLGLLFAAARSLADGMAFINTRMSLVIFCRRSIRSYISLSSRLSSARARPARHSMRNTERSASDTEFKRATSIHSSARGSVLSASAAPANVGSRQRTTRQVRRRASAVRAQRRFTYVVSCLLIPNEYAESTDIRLYPKWSPAASYCAAQHVSSLRAARLRRAPSVSDAWQKLVVASPPLDRPLPGNRVGGDCWRNNPDVQFLRARKPARELARSQSDAARFSRRPTP